MMRNPMSKRAFLKTAEGELLGAGQFMGRSYCGGMLVTPALTFGRLLGQRMLKFDV